MPAFHVTYDVITPESAEHGDYAEQGFVRQNGTHDELPHDCHGDAAARFKTACGMRLNDAIDLIGCLEDSGSGFSYYETDGRQDYRTGAETRYAFHLPDNTTPSSLNRVARLLRARKLLR